MRVAWFVGWTARTKSEGNALGGAVGMGPLWRKMRLHDAIQSIDDAAKLHFTQESSDQ